MGPAYSLRTPPLTTVRMPLAVAPREFRVSPGEALTVDVDSRVLSSLRIRFDQPQDSSSLIGIVVTRLASLEEPRPSPARVLPPGVSIMNLNAVSTAESALLRQIWFTEGGVPIEVCVGRPGRETLVRRLELRHAGTAEIRVP